MGGQKPAYEGLEKLRPTTMLPVLQDKIRGNTRLVCVFLVTHMIIALLVCVVLAASLTRFSSDNTRLVDVVAPPETIQLGESWPTFAVQVLDADGLVIGGQRVSVSAIPLDSYAIDLVGASVAHSQVESVACLSEEIRTPTGSIVVAAHAPMCTARLVSRRWNGTGLADYAAASTSDETGVASFANISLDIGIPGVYAIIARLAESEVESEEVRSYATWQQINLVQAAKVYYVRVSPPVQRSFTNFVATPLTTSEGYLRVTASFTATWDVPEETDVFATTNVSTPPSLPVLSGYISSMHPSPEQLVDIVGIAVRQTESYAAHPPKAVLQFAEGHGETTTHNVTVSRVQRFDATGNATSSTLWRFHATLEVDVTITASDADSVHLAAIVLGVAVPLRNDLGVAAPIQMPSRPTLTPNATLDSTAVTEGVPFRMSLDAVPSSLSAAGTPLVISAWLDRPAVASSTVTASTLTSTQGLETKALIAPLLLRTDGATSLNTPQLFLLQTTVTGDVGDYELFVSVNGRLVGLQVNGTTTSRVVLSVRSRVTGVSLEASVNATDAVTIGVPWQNTPAIGVYDAFGNAVAGKQLVLKPSTTDPATVAANPTVTFLSTTSAADGRVSFIQVLLLTSSTEGVLTFDLTVDGVTWATIQRFANYTTSGLTPFSRCSAVLAEVIPGTETLKLTAVDQTQAVVPFAPLEIDGSGATADTSGEKTVSPAANTVLRASCAKNAADPQTSVAGVQYFIPRFATSSSAVQVVPVDAPNSAATAPRVKLVLLSDVTATVTVSVTLKLIRWDEGHTVFATAGLPTVYTTTVGTVGASFPAGSAAGDESDVTIDAGSSFASAIPGDQIMEVHVDDKPTGLTYRFRPSAADELAALAITTSAFVGEPTSSSTPAPPSPARLVESVVYGTAVGAPTVQFLDSTGATVAAPDRLTVMAFVGYSTEPVDAAASPESVVWDTPTGSAEVASLAGAVLDGSTSDSLQPPSAQATASATTVTLPVLRFSSASSAVYTYVRYCVVSAITSSSTCKAEAVALRFNYTANPNVTASTSVIPATPGTALPPISLTVTLPQGTASYELFVVIDTFGQEEFVDSSASSSNIASTRRDATTLTGVVVITGFSVATSTLSGEYPVRIAGPGIDVRVSILVSSTPESVRLLALPSSIMPINDFSALVGAVYGAGGIPMPGIVVHAQFIRSNCTQREACGVLNPASVVQVVTNSDGLAPFTFAFDAAAAGSVAVTASIDASLSSPTDLGIPLAKQQIIASLNSRGSDIGSFTEVNADTAALVASVRTEVIAVERAEAALLEASSSIVSSALVSAATGGVPDSSQGVAIAVSAASLTFSPIVVEVQNPVVGITLEQDVPAGTHVEATVVGDAIRTLVDVSVPLDLSAANAPVFRLFDSNGAVVQKVPVTVFLIFDDDGDLLTSEEAQSAKGISFVAPPGGLVSNATGHVSLAGGRLLANRSATFQLAVSSRGGGLAQTQGGIQFTLEVATLLDTMQLLAILLVVCFLPMYMANVRHTFWLYPAVAAVFTIAVLTFLGVTINTTLERFETLFIRLYLGFGFVLMSIAVLGYTWLALRVVGYPVLIKKLLAHFNDGAVVACRIFSRFLGPANGEVRAWQDHAYAKWMFQHRVEHQQEREMESWFSRTYHQFMEWSELKGISIKYCAQRPKTTEAKALKNRREQEDRVAVMQRFELRRFHVTHGTDGRLRLVRPDSVPDTAMVPINLQIVVAVAIVLLMLVGFITFNIYEVMRRGLLRLISFFPNPHTQADRETLELIFDQSITLMASAGTKISAATGNPTVAAQITAVAGPLVDFDMVAFGVDTRIFLNGVLDALLPSTITAVVLAALAVLVVLALCVSSALWHIRTIRRGPFETPLNHEYFEPYTKNPGISRAEAYVGLHVMHLTGLFILVVVVVFALLMSVLVDEIRDNVWRPIVILIFTSLASTILQVLLRVILVENVLMDGWHIVRPEWYAWYSLFDMVLGFFSAIAGTVLRLVQMLFYSIITFAKVDRSLYPDVFWSMDVAHLGFAGVVAAEARNNNSIYLNAAAALLTPMYVRASILRAALQRIEQFEGSDAAWHIRDVLSGKKTVNTDMPPIQVNHKSGSDLLCTRRMEKSVSGVDDARADEHIAALLLRGKLVTEYIQLAHEGDASPVCLPVRRLAAWSNVSGAVLNLMRLQLTEECLSDPTLEGSPSAAEETLNVSTLTRYVEADDERVSKNAKRFAGQAPKNEAVWWYARGMTVDAVAYVTKWNGGKRRARNRWLLAILLVRNPSLVKYRKHNLPGARIVADPLETQGAVAKFLQKQQEEERVTSSPFGSSRSSQQRQRSRAGPTPAPSGSNVEQPSGDVVWYARNPVVVEAVDSPRVDAV